MLFSMAFWTTHMKRPQREGSEQKKAKDTDQLCECDSDMRVGRRKVQKLCGLGPHTWIVPSADCKRIQNESPAAQS